MGSERLRLGLTDKEGRKDLGGNKLTIRRLAGAVHDWSINSTAEHEAYHADAAVLVGLTVFKATDQPSAEYAGATWTSGYEPRMVAAPAAFGCDGTGHDLATIEENGDSVDHAIRGARSLLSGRADEVSAIATEIQKRGTATGTQMLAAAERVLDDQIEVRVETPSGHTETKRGRLINNVIDLPIDRGL